MKARLISCSFLLLLFGACTSDNNAVETAPPLLFEQPVVNQLDLDKGHVINLFTGDTVKLVLTPSGDTIITGRPIPLKGTTVYPDSILIQEIKMPAPAKVTPALHINEIAVPELLTTVIQKDSVQTSETRVKPEPYYALNALGDTLITGKPTHYIANSSQVKWPQVTPALQPRVREDAKTNLLNYDQDQGILNSNINQLYQDSRGNIWIGSYFGISCFNGSSFLHFSDEEILNDMIFCITEDKAGNMWFGTNTKGAARLNVKSGELTHFNADGNFLNNSVRWIEEDKNGKIWFATGAGASFYDPAKNEITHITSNEGFRDNRVPALHIDGSGKVWFSNWEKGATVYDPSTGIYSYYDKLNGLSSNIVMSISGDDDGNTWLCTHGGVDKFDPITNTITAFRKEHGLLEYAAKMVLVDEFKKVWMVTGLGLCVYDPSRKALAYYRSEEGFGSSLPVCMMQDNNNNKWVGTYGGGMCVIRAGKEFRFLGDADGLTSDYVYMVNTDRSGKKWICTNRGLNCYDPVAQTFSHYNRPVNHLLDDNVRSAWVDYSGKIWIGTYSQGVTCYDPAKGTLKSYLANNGLIHNSVVQILENPDSTIWFATHGGLSLYNPAAGAMTNYGIEDGLSYDRLYQIVKDKQGNLWLGTGSGGISKIDRDIQTITHYTEREGLSNNDAQNVVIDKHGHAWAATRGGGINRINFATNEVLYFGEKQGMTNDHNYSVIEDEKGRIWAATSSGLNLIEQIDPDSAKETWRVTTFAKSAGLGGTDMYSAHPYVDDEQYAWWGTNQSLTRLNLNNVSVSDVTPNPQLTQIDINGGFIDYRQMADSTKENIHFSEMAEGANYPLNLELAYDQNHLTFHFAAMDWNAPDKLQYQYLLKGLDNKWSQVSTKTSAEYRNIPPGEFVFCVRAIGENQVWGETFKYAFVVLPPWWQTWWAKAAYGLLAILLIFGFVKWRTARLRQRQKELETEVDNATHEIRKQKELIEEKHKEITDSINYAERIQRSFLATSVLLDENLRDYFVYFQPKEAVSGDFYWAGKLNDGSFAWSVADSTGHGVPGAIMSILNISAIEKSVENETRPDLILNRTRNIIIDRLKKDGSADGGKDGMDCALLVLNSARTQLSFAAAHNPVIVVRRGDLMEFKADKMPVGKHERDKIPFTLQHLDLQKGDVIYALTDGLADQFGGPKGKKFMQKNLKGLLLEIAEKPMAEQHSILRDALENWRGELEQIDDICILGVRI